MFRPALACAMTGLLGTAAWTPVPPRRPAMLPPRLECSVVPVPNIDSLMDARRFWHASRSLPPLRGTRPVPAESVLQRAIIAEGLERFSEVEALIRRARGGDTLTAFLLLAARVDERAERWNDAAAKYRRVLRLGDPTSEGSSGRLASARLAFVMERLGARDSAVAWWRRAAQYSPEIADWFALRRAALERDTAIAFGALSAPRTPGALQQSQLFMAARRSALGDHEGALAGYELYGRPLDVARMEFAMGRRARARARADSLLFLDPSHPYNPNSILAATFLHERFDPLTLQENLAAATAYHVRRDLRGAERFALAAVAQGRRLRPDTSVGGWLMLAQLQAERRDLLGSLRSIDSAARRLGRRHPAIGIAQVRALLATEYVDRADELLGVLTRTTGADTSVARGLLLFADRHRLRGEAEAERSRYRVLLARYAETRPANVARFRVALNLYLAGDRDSALALVSEAARRDSTHSMGLGPRYWEARIRFEKGDSTAVTTLRALADQYPIMFYGVRAREILGDTTFLSDTTPALPRPGSFPPARARERIRMLASLGFDVEARAEAVGWATDTSASVYVLMAAAASAGEAGYARESILLGDSARRRVGMVPGVARALFPISYRAIIEAEAEEHCVDPLLMAALIRQESRFDPRAVSRVGARGMSQVMPATGAQIAQQRRLGPWDPELLFVPDFNLHLGARYLADRMARDTFPVYALLASYNAGPSRVQRWKNWPEYSDTDLFAERISIAETRDYVRTIYASYVWYRYAWASPPPAPAERSAPLP